MNDIKIRSKNTDKLEEITLKVKAVMFENNVENEAKDTVKSARNLYKE